MKASDFRYSNVLPSPLIDLFAGKEIKAIRFLKNFHQKSKWWEYESEVEIDFESSENSDNWLIAKTCGVCGLCCKDIPTHQIGIYMSEGEVKVHGLDIVKTGSKLETNSYLETNSSKLETSQELETGSLELETSKLIVQGEVIVGKVKFYVLAVQENGDCSMLGENGCKLGDKRPLWCKIYHCEKFQGKEYIYDKSSSST